MKKRILPLIAVAAFLVTGIPGCTFKEATESLDPGTQFGRFIVLEDEGSYRQDEDIICYEYLVYDVDTYIIYIYTWTQSGGASLSPFYCMNDEDEPEIAIYWDGME